MMPAIKLDDRQQTIVMGRSLCRSSSPGTIRLETRVKDLEDQLDEERATRIQTERELAEINAEFDVLNADFQNARDQIDQQEETIKRREQEFARVHRELATIRDANEERMETLKRRHQTTVNELNLEINVLQKAKSKAEKERSEMAKQLENAFVEVEDANKAKAVAQTRQETLESQTIRLRANYEDSQKRITELNSQNAELLSEVTGQSRTIEKLNTCLASCQRAQSIAESIADDHRRALEEEIKTRTMFQSKLNTMQKELDASVHRADEEAENAEKLQSQLTRFTSELAQTKSKYEKMFSEKTEEFDELKRRLNNRINELTESYELERGRVVSLERTKNQLTHQCQEIQSQLDNLCGECTEQAQTIKSLESQKTELEAVLEEAQTEESNLRTKCGLLQRDLIQIRATKSEMEERVAVLEKENKQNSEKLKETKERLSVVNRQVTDLESSQARLEAERDNLDTTLRDTEDALHECEARYQTTFSALSTLRNEFERQSRDKEEELESLRRSNQRNVENLKAAIADMEMKSQNELDRLKKKLEGNINNLQVQLEEEKSAHLEIVKVHEEAEAHICQLEMNMAELNNLVSETANTLQICESRRSVLANEAEGLRCQLEITEKLKRKLEEESCENMSKFGGLTLQVNNLTIEKRRLESQVAVLQGDLDDATSAKNVAAERADRLQNEVNRLVQELQTEQELSRRSDTARRQMEAELKECNAKILDSRRAAETAEREADDVRSQADNKIRELQLALEEESKKAREAQAQLRKCERSLKESVQAEQDASHMIGELREMVERAQTKLKQTRKQLEEAENAAQTAAMKYRKAQQQVDDADLRAQMAERRIGLTAHEDNSVNLGKYNRQRSGSLYPTRTRNYSVTREGSVFSVMSEIPSSPHKTRFQVSIPKWINRYESGSQQKENGSSLSLLDLPPADTSNS
ncbi:hypothetical protein MN116_004118 [Schistosoma mekongi]|uniref:Myosin tail domain-containing protein n=1 Tax=Schistosoma mekongi TaxID=38744 RepID=A0AAE1ZGK1_SCHME|nr:hypothetical protein MN116_004118 [Schistosoma mekongi]